MKKGEEKTEKKRGHLFVNGIIIEKLNYAPFLKKKIVAYPRVLSFSFSFPFPFPLFFINNQFF